jgi:hypothetical protein
MQRNKSIINYYAQHHPLVRAITQWRAAVAQKPCMRPRMWPKHTCSSQTCRFVIFNDHVHVCTLTGNFHTCTADLCQAIVETNSYAICSITGTQYPLQLVTPMDREVVDFASKITAVPTEAKRPGPRPKEVTTSRDTEHLRRTALSVVQRLLDATATRYVDPATVAATATIPDTSSSIRRPRKKQKSITTGEAGSTTVNKKISTRRYKEVPKQKVGVLTDDFKQRFTTTCLQSWNYITTSAQFPPHRNTYLFENHCMVVIFFAKDKAGFICKGFNIPYETALGQGIINRAHLSTIGQGRVYTTTVRLFRQFVQSLESPA